MPELVTTAIGHLPSQPEEFLAALRSLLQFDRDDSDADDADENDADDNDSDDNDAGDNDADESCESDSDESSEGSELDAVSA